MVVYFNQEGDTIFYEVQPDTLTARTGEVHTIKVDLSMTGMCDADWVMDRIESDYKIDTLDGHFEGWVDPIDCGWHPMTDRLIITKERLSSREVS